MKHGDAKRPAIFTVPILLGIASLTALIVGLLGEGLLDLFAWVGLAIPLLAIAWALAKRRA